MTDQKPSTHAKPLQSGQSPTISARAPVPAKFKTLEGKTVAPEIRIQNGPPINEKMQEASKVGTAPPPKVLYVGLDDSGKPSGAVLLDPPTDGTPYAVVAAVVDPDTEEVMMTPSGAPITDNMNPSLHFADAGMLARNPPPPRPDMKKIMVDEAAKQARIAGEQNTGLVTA